MKKWWAACAMINAVLHAEPTVHFGIGGIAGMETFTVENPGQPEQQTEAALAGVQFKAGYGSMMAYAVEFNLGYAWYDKNVFSNHDGDYLYFDLCFIKAFDFDIGAYPFFKLGFGMGELAMERTLTNSLSSGSFLGGVGIYLPLGAGFDVEFSTIYRAKSWGDLDLIGAYVESSSHLLEPYLGINFRY